MMQLISFKTLFGLVVIGLLIAGVFHTMETPGEAQKVETAAVSWWGKLKNLFHRT